MSDIIRRMKDLPSTHLLGTGTPMCSGCGALEALHQIYDVLGEKTVFVNNLKNDEPRNKFKKSRVLRTPFLPEVRSGCFKSKKAEDA